MATDDQSSTHGVDNDGMSTIAGDPLNPTRLTIHPSGDTQSEQNSPKIIHQETTFDYIKMENLLDVTISVKCHSNLGLFKMTTEEFNIDTVEEVVSLVENVSMEDFSLDLTPDDVVALDTIKKTVVGKFFIKRKIGNGRLRSIFSEMWNVSPWWRLQEISPNIFTFRFPRESDALKGIENVPWAPCGGFMLVTLMLDDEK
ncbi:hypothetical protein F8388_022030 [Cannabis sativa]|uniref:DUF4283 domain-containing protein n=1 Tax=Cannabis sativa TaxID=3483 RepID=A0A7J6G7H5_CANSA|nr:hypothetical protein F8388_022030 [Cannabis sativa]